MSGSKAEEANLEEVQKKIELAMTQLDRQFGKGTVMRLDEEPEPWPAHSSGALTLDIALAIGGFPKGRIVEIYGPESSGKSTVCLNVIANAQKNGGRCLFIDAEHAVDPGYAQALGVNLNDLIFAQPSTGEEALQILEMMISTGGIQVAVIDSVAALVPKAELEGEMGQSHVGLLPRLMAQAMRKLTGLANNTGTTIIFVNQIREKVGVMFGSPETQPGGRALKFHSSVRLDLRKRESLKNKAGDNIIGSRIEAKVVKNKMGSPYRKAEFKIIYGKGVNWLDSVRQAAVDYGVFETKGGGWYRYNDEAIGQGDDAVVEYLASDLDLVKQIEQEIYENAGLSVRRLQ